MLCSNAEPDREALSSDCPSGCISLKSVGCVWYMPCMDVAGVCAPNDRHRVEALRSFLQDDQAAEMRGSGGSSTGYDPMRSSELDHPSDSSALASEEQHAAAAVSQQRSLGPESAEVEDDAPVDDRQTRQDAHQAQEAVDNGGDEAEETEQAQRADDNQPQHGAVFVSPGTAGASSRSPQDAVLVCRSCLQLKAAASVTAAAVEKLLREEQVQKCAAQNAEQQLRLQLEQLQKTHLAMAEEHKQELRQLSEANRSLRATHHGDLEAGKTAEQQLRLQLEQLQKTHVAMAEEHKQELRQLSEANRSLRADVGQSGLAHAQQHQEIEQLEQAQAQASLLMLQVTELRAEKAAEALRSKQEVNRS